MYIIVSKSPRGLLKKPNFYDMFTKLINYLKGTKAELSAVNWPTKKQTINYTLLVIGFSLFVAAFLGFSDKLFSYLIQTFVL